MSREGADMIAMHICLAKGFTKPGRGREKVTVTNHQ